MFEGLLHWWRSRRHHLLVRTPLPHVMPPLVRLPVGTGAEMLALEGESMPSDMMLCGKCGLDLSVHVRRGNPDDDVARCEDGAAYEFRAGDWMQTCSGRRFWFLDPRSDEIHFDDIAVGLSNLCRFTGQCQPFYSVAQHSVFVAELVQALGGRIELARPALLHDGSEAYLSDLPRPLKYLMPEYKVIEKLAEDAIEKKFDITLSADDRALIKLADRIALHLERRALFADKLRWGEDGSAITRQADELRQWHEWPKVALTPLVAYQSFVAAWNKHMLQELSQRG
jgi:hypothetical protein